MTEAIGNERQLKKILFLTKRFYPHGDANSVVIRNVAEEMVRQNIEVEVLAFTCEKKETQIKNWKGIKIRNIYLPGFIESADLKKIIFTRPFHFICCLVQKTCGKVISQRKKYRTLSANYLYVRTYRQELRKIIQKEEYDLCVLNMMPHETVIAASELVVTTKETKLAVYQLDTYWNNDLFPRKYQDVRIELEKKMPKMSRFILTTPQIVKTNKELYGQDAGKLIAAEFPMIKKPARSKKKNDGRIHCAFIGTLYADIRPPEKIIALIAEIQQDDIIFDFYGSNQDLIIKDPLYFRAKDNICLHGVVSVEEAERARNEAGILINIDNTNIHQVPSKIFEYISTGKPILNFYFNDNSPILAYTSRYPLCCSICVSQYDNSCETANVMCQYIRDSNNKRISLREIEKTFHKNTPEYVTSQFINALSL